MVVLKKVKKRRRIVVVVPDATQQCKLRCTLFFFRGSDMDTKNIVDVVSFETKDGSQIRELLS